MSISKEILEQYRALRASTVYEGAGKCGDMGSEIRPVGEDTRIVAPAFTVRCWPGDGSAMMRAVDEAERGAVLVIDAGSSHSATWGGGATLAAIHRGLAGVVSNGSVRDVEQIHASRFPVFCTGISVRGGVRNHRGWTGIPIAVGGAVIHPGDLIVADIDGVVVVPQERAEETLLNALKRKAHEEESDRRLAEGTSYSVLTGIKLTLPG